jgi:hypothetical protein
MYVPVPVAFTTVVALARVGYGARYLELMVVFCEAAVVSGATFVVADGVTKDDVMFTLFTAAQVAGSSPYKIVNIRRA